MFPKEVEKLHFDLFVMILKQRHDKEYMGALKKVVDFLYENLGVVGATGRPTKL
jgi:hypothetical protein